MRRSVPAVIVTFIGLGALLSFKSSPGAPKSSSALPVDRSGAVAAAPPPDTTTPATGTTPAPGTTPTPTTTTPTTGGNTARAVDGDPVDNRYGTVQVRVTLQGTRITGVTPLQMPFDRERSAEISQQAEPLLLQEVLQAQTARIDIIGGATYTTESYAQSLQSALDKAGR